MLVRLLQSFEPFAQLEYSRLCTLARHASLVTAPAGRWLLRPGRVLAGSCYLVAGRLHLQGPDEIVQAGTPRARRPAYPGAQGIQALTAVRLLRVRADPVAFLLGNEPAEAGPSSDEGIDWQLRFLQSGVIQRLSPACWQRLLRSMTPISGTAGELIVRQNEVADTFYVLTRGQAEVCRGGTVLARLQAGDFFGEDALITGARRNADVRLVTDAVVMQLGSRPFLDWVLSGAVRMFQPPADAGAVGNWQYCRPSAEAGQLVFRRLQGMDLRGRYEDIHLALRQLRESLALLDAKTSYLVMGASPGERALAAFVLTHKGFDVQMLAAASTPSQVR